MELAWAVLLLIACGLCWALNFVGLPGNWLIAVLGILYAHFGPSDGRLDMDWGVVAGLVTLALLGEAIEFVAGAVGVRKAGGSKRGAILALVGSMVGGILGMFVGMPIPVIGQLVAAVLLAALGALGGAVLGERWKGRDYEESFRVGEAAFWSRMLGTLGKSLVGAVMLGVVTAAVLF